VVRIEGQADMPKRSDNQSLFNLGTPALSACGHAQAGKPQGPVECLGMTFENDEIYRQKPDIPPQKTV